MSQKTAQSKPLRDRLAELRAIIAHDLHSPIRHITVFAQLLERDNPDLSEAGHVYLNQIIQSVDKLDAQIDALSFYIKALSESPKPQTFKFSQCWAQTVQSLQSELINIKLDINISDLPPIYADPEQVEQVLAELVQNSLKHGKTDPLTLKIDAQINDSDAQIRFADTGVGLDLAYKTTCFEILNTFPISTSAPVSSGLAICRAIIEAQGGKMVFDETYQQGFAVKFTLPLAKD